MIFLSWSTCGREAVSVLPAAAVTACGSAGIAFGPVTVAPCMARSGVSTPAGPPAASTGAPGTGFTATGWATLRGRVCGNAGSSTPKWCFGGAGTDADADAVEATVGVRRGGVAVGFAFLIGGSSILA